MVVACGLHSCPPLLGQICNLYYFCRFNFVEYRVGYVMHSNKKILCFTYFLVLYNFLCTQFTDAKDKTFVGNCIAWKSLMSVIYWFRGQSLKFVTVRGAKGKGAIINNILI